MSMHFSLMCMQYRHDQYAISFFSDANHLFLCGKNARKQGNVFEKTKQPGSTVIQPFVTVVFAYAKHLNTSC